MVSSLVTSIFTVSLSLLLIPAGATQKPEGRPGDAGNVQQLAENVELVSQLGGSTHAVAVQGSYAYVGVGARLVVLDVSNPADPAVLGQTAVLLDIVRDIFVSGDYAYIAAGDAGLRVIDVSDPAAPAEVGSYVPAETALDVHVAGNYAYVAAFRDGLRVVDVSDPTAPVEVGVYDMAGVAGGIYVAGRYAYVVETGLGYLHIVDVSQPSQPVGVAISHHLRGAVAVYVSGNYAYIAARNAGLWVRGQLSRTRWGCTTGTAHSG